MDPNAACASLLDVLDSPGWKPTVPGLPDEVEALTYWLKRGGFAPMRAKTLLIKILRLRRSTEAPLAAWRPWVVLCERLATAL